MHYLLINMTIIYLKKLDIFWLSFDIKLQKFYKVAC